MIHSPSFKERIDAELDQHLSTQRIGRSVRFFEKVASTNTEAMHWAHEDAPEGSLVMAEFQTGGKGRQGRLWQADRSKNLLFSLVLRPTLPTTHWGLITIAASMAVKEAIDAQITPLETTIKWPNDVLIEGRKCCGMLLETVTTGRSGESNPPLILGIGINVNQEVFPDDLNRQATSILLESGRHTPRVELLGRLLNALERHYDAIQLRQDTRYIETYETSMAFINEKSCLHFPGKATSIEGTIRGISSTGALRLETQDGERLFHAGEVTTNPDR